MNKGIAVYINGIEYWFEDYEDLMELLDMNCNDCTSGSAIQNGVIFDEDLK